jgi:Flp pilus assembly protein TadD
VSQVRDYRRSRKLRNKLRCVTRDAIVLLVTGRTSDAIDEYKEALRITPNSAEAHNSLAAALAQMGQVSEAIEQLKAALRINPNHPDARNNLTKLEAEQKTTPARE